MNTKLVTTPFYIQDKLVKSFDVVKSITLGTYEKAVVAKDQV